MLETRDGRPGWLCTFYNVDASGAFTDAVAEYVLIDTRVKVNDFLPKGLGEEWGMIIEGLLTIDKSMKFEFGLAVAGKAYTINR